jgi:hypothetical protein
LLAFIARSDQRLITSGVGAKAGIGGSPLTQFFFYEVTV